MSGYNPNNNNFNYQGAYAGQPNQFMQQNDQNFPQLGGGAPQQQQQQFQQFPQQQQQWNAYPQQQQQQWAAPQQFAQPMQQQPTAAPAGMGGFAGFASFAPFDTTSMKTALNTSSSAPTQASGGYVPKSRQAQTGGDYPSLGENQSQPTVQKKELEDPCDGKPKEFFIYSLDPATGVCICTPDQLKFVAIHYTEYYFTPIDILGWLYDMAVYRDEEKQKKFAKPAASGQQIQPSGTKPKTKKQVVEEYDEVDDEETSFGPKSYKDMQKKKPVAPPTRPQIGKDGKQLSEAQKEEERKKKLKAMEEAKRKEEERKMRKDVGKDKDIATLETENKGEMVEVDETRQPCSLVFIGHVDAGKSTISGNLMYSMGVVDKRTIDKYKEEAKSKNRESWWLAYVMDENEEEKAKGKTIEIGRANFDTPKKRWTIFDAPGHKNYVPNMIMGAALADYGALVISAKKGEFEAGFEAEGQTREHVQLAKSLGIYKLVVVVNKMDEPTVKWSKERFTEIVNSLRPFLAQSGYDPDKDCTFIPVSGLQGDNIDKVLDKSVCNWYSDGRHLLQVLDDLPVPPRDEKGLLRVPILDKMQDRGAVVFGKVESGTIRLGDQLKLMPSGISCQVHTVYNSKDQCVRYAKPGENVKLRLNIDNEERVNKGDVVCHRDQTLVPVSELFEAEVDIQQLIDYKPILSKGYQCILHIHTVADDATIKEILVSYEKNERGEIIEKQKPQYCRSFTKIICRIQTRIPIALEKHDQIPQLGRFTLRDEGRTIAVGKVLKYKPAKDIIAVAPAQKLGSTSSLEETKSSGSATTTSRVKEDLVYDMESGEMLTKEEHNKRKTERDQAQLDGINEDDEAEDEAPASKK